MQFSIHFSILQFIPSADNLNYYFLKYKDKGRGWYYSISKLKSNLQLSVQFGIDVRIEKYINKAENDPQIVLYTVVNIFLK